jgi:site-specific DNA-methyltransferase (cytosine-N4-specific)
MEGLLRRKKYNVGKRPSEHNIGQTSFLSDHGGAIPPSVITERGEEELSNVLIGSNTTNSDPYLRYCKSKNIPLHPARMPVRLAEFFIQLCTTEGDIVLDPFAGSNTTGAAAQMLTRTWVSIEANSEYAMSGKGRFDHTRRHC